MQAITLNVQTIKLLEKIKEHRKKRYHLECSDNELIYLALLRMERFE